MKYVAEYRLCQSNLNTSKNRQDDQVDSVSWSPYLSQAVVPLCYCLLQLKEGLSDYIKGIPELSYLINKIDSRHKGTKRFLSPHYIIFQHYPSYIKCIIIMRSDYMSKN